MPCMQANDLLKACAAAAMHRGKEARRLQRGSPAYRSTMLQVQHPF